MTDATYPASFDRARAVEIFHAEQRRTPDVHARGRIYYPTRDATGHHWRRVTCWVEDGELVQAHPTDPRHWPIAAPHDVEFALEMPTVEDIEWRHEQERLAAQESA